MSAENEAHSGAQKKERMLNGEAYAQFFLDWCAANSLSLPGHFFKLNISTPVR